MFTEKDLYYIKSDPFFHNNAIFLEIFKRYKNAPFNETIHGTFNCLFNYHHLQKNGDAYLSHDLKSQMIIELLLQILDFFSTQTPNRINSTPKFIDKTILSNTKISSVTYSSEKSLNVTLREINPPSTFVNRTNNDNSNSYFLKNSPLADYVYSHVNFLPPKNNQFKRARYSFVEDGKYFLAVLLRATKSGDAPYTLKNKDGISLQSLNKLLMTFASTYSSADELKSNSLERFQFLINTESVFHFSFAQQVFSNYRCIFADYGANSTLGFKNSLYLINALQKLPLETLKISLWKNHILDFFDENQDYKTTQTFMTFNPIFHIAQKPSFSTLIMELERYNLEIQSLINDFFYLILRRYNILRLERIEELNNSNNSISKSAEIVESKNTETQNTIAIETLFLKDNIPLLQSEIIKFLEQCEDNHPEFFDWSIIEKNRNKNVFYDVIPSIGNDFFNFLCSYAIYCTGDPESPDFMGDMEFQYGVNRYLSFSLNHQKEKSKDNLTPGKDSPSM